MTTPKMLTLPEIDTQGEWVSIADHTGLTEEYRRLTDASDAKLPGFAVVLARRAFTGDRPLPPGGVLLGITTAFTDTGGASPHHATQHRTSVSQRRDRRGNLIVQIEVTLGIDPVPGTPPTAVTPVVTFALRWPEPRRDDLTAGLTMTTGKEATRE